MESYTDYNIKVPGSFWEDLERGDIESLCKNALAGKQSRLDLILPFFNEVLGVDMKNRCLLRKTHTHWERINNPLLELISLAYLIGAGPEPLRNEMISVKDLKSAHFFKGPHELKIRPLLDRYGYDIDGFKKSADRLGGKTLDMADTAYRFLVFPKVPLYYLFWRGDQEFKPRLSVLFDRSIENHLAPDTIWGLVTLVSDLLLLDANLF
jgi:hypothetical protein